MAMQASDIVMTALLLVVLLGFARVIYDFIGEISASTGLLTQLILSITVPALFIMLVMSAAHAARSDR